MMRFILAAVGIMAITIVAISSFLRVDSLSRCGAYPNDMKGCQKADVVVAVSGGDTSGRTQQAIDLYERGWGDKLIFSGAALDPGSPSNAEVMRTQAIKQGVPSEAIIIEPASANTSENADKTAEILADIEAQSAILVTSGYHQKRTLIEFEHKSPEIEFRTQPSASDRQWSVWWWTTPHGWYLAVSEVIKIAVITLGGR